MTQREAELALRRTLDRVYRRSQMLSRREISTYERALRGISRGLSGGSASTLTAERAASLDRLANQLLRRIEETLLRSADRAVADVSTTVQQEYAAVHARLFKVQGLPTGGVVARFDVLPTRINQRLFALYGRNLTAATLVRRNVDAARASISQYIEAVTGRVADRTAVESISRILRGELPVDIGGMNPTALTPARGLAFRGRRIIVTESFNAMREGTVEGSAQSPIILAGRWTLSDRHSGLPSSPDACDDLANGGRLIEGIRGWYSPLEYPIAPHPNCECRQGAVVVLSPEEWEAALV